MHRRGKELNNGINSGNAFLVNRFSNYKYLETNSLRPVEELKDLPTARDFLVWMRRRYFPSVPTDKFLDDTFSAIQRNLCSDTRSKQNQDFSGIYSTGLQFLLSDKMSNYHDQNTVYNDAYTYQKGDSASKLEGATNDSNFKLNVPQKFWHMSRYSKSDRTEALFSHENQCMLKDRLRKERVKDVKTKLIKENGKRKPIHNGGVVTVDDIVEMPYNLSKNPVDVHDSVDLSVEEDLIYFAPYEDYETDEEEVDENSILAKHQRNYRVILEAKGLQSGDVTVKDSFVSNKQNSYDQLQLTSKNSKFSAKKMCFNDKEHVGETKNKSDDEEDEEEIDYNSKIDPEVYFDDTFEQNEAIDYSIKSKSDSHSKMDDDGEKDEINLTIYSKKLPGSELEEFPPNIEDRRTDTYTYVFDAPVACNESLKGNSNTLEELISCSSSDKTSCSGISKHANSSKTSSCSMKNNAGLVNSVDKLGVFFPVAQNKVMSFDEENSEKFNGFGTDALGKKAQCTELLRLCTMDVQSKIIERNGVGKTDDMQKDNTCTRREKKTFEEVIDSMITDILGIRESW